MRQHSGLLTDLYELTMAAGYVQTGFDARATFELFVRDLPTQRGYLIAAGLEQALDFLERVTFETKEIDYLRRHPAFAHVAPAFFDYLGKFRFRGEVWAMPEGTPVFPEEPLLRVTASIAEAQIVETLLLATISHQTMIASKAARVVGSARGRRVIEFGTRRAHGIEAGVLAARAAYIGGCHGTSNVQAGQRFGVPTYGTLAHSWIMAQEDEAEAFRRFLHVFPEHSILLLDTYDVRAALEKIFAMRVKPRGLRLDSGDLTADSRWVRERLDRHGWQDVEIFASGDLDEHRITALLDGGAHINGFGVGTALATSADAPSLGAVYKLVEVERDGGVRKAAKFSDAKTTYPGRKQVFRLAGPEGGYQRDIIALQEEALEGTPLLVQVMRDGRRMVPSPPLDDVRMRAREALERLPEACRRLQSPPPYPVERSARLEELMKKLRAVHARARTAHPSEES